MLTDATFRTTDQVGTITQDYVNGGYAIDHRENTYRFVQAENRIVMIHYHIRVD